MRPSASRPRPEATATRQANRFERHALRSGLGLLGSLLLLGELVLRLGDPQALRFAQEMRRVHRYSRTSWVDLVPSRSVHLRLDRPDGSKLLDFRIITSPEAFRIPQAAPPARRPTQFVHAVGDSFAMGWGVEAEDAWPARLGNQLPDGMEVVNLGVDGFGAVGATAKSMALADRFPPAVAIHLFSPNDLDDDERASAARPLAAHLALGAFDAARRASAIANLPFALRYWLFYRAAAASQPPAPTGEPTTDHLIRPRLDVATLPAPETSHPTFAALRRYRDFLAERGARLAVLVLSTQEPSLRAYRFCKEQDIEAVLFDVPPELRIPGDGHFSESGNRAVAALALSVVSSGIDRGGSAPPASEPGREP